MVRVFIQHKKKLIKILCKIYSASLDRWILLGFSLKSQTLDKSFNSLWFSLFIISKLLLKIKHKPKPKPTLPPIKKALKSTWFFVIISHLASLIRNIHILTHTYIYLSDWERFTGSRFPREFAKVRSREGGPSYANNQAGTSL